VTTLTESFNKADGALGPDQAWTVDEGTVTVVSNKAARASAAGDSTSRINTLADTVNHYVEVTVASDNADAGSPAAMCRKAASATLTHYFSALDYSTSPNADEVTLFRRVGGAYTSLATGSSLGDIAAVTEHVIKLEVNGSSLSTFYDGVAKHTNVTDTTIDGTSVGGKAIGICGGEAGNITWDGLTAADIPSPPGPITAPSLNCWMGGWW